MAQDEVIPSKSSDMPSPEHSVSSSSKGSFAMSLNKAATSRPIYRRYCRSKSLSNIFPESYTHGEIARMRERLLRYDDHQKFEVTFSIFLILLIQKLAVYAKKGVVNDYSSSFVEDETMIYII